MLLAVMLENLGGIVNVWKGNWPGGLGRESPSGVHGQSPGGGQGGKALPLKLNISLQTTRNFK